MKSYGRKYSRIEINREFRRVKASMHNDALKKGLDHFGEEVAYYEDVYTGLIFKGGDNYEYEHIRSSESLFMRFRDSHTNEEIALIVNHPCNVSVTHFNINRYKDKYSIEERILSNPKKIKEFKIDIELTKKNVLRADQAIEEISNCLIIGRNVK